MNKNKIILVGGGGHCISCIDVIEQENKYEIVGILDVKENLNNKIMGYPVIGTDDDMGLVSKECKYFLVTIGQLKNYKIRQQKFEMLKKLDVTLPVVVSPRAYVSSRSSIGEGSIIMHDAVINSGVKIGSNCIINTKSLVEHETVIGDNSHISTNVVVNGQCDIGADVFIGSSSVISNNIRIADRTVIGAGSVVVRNILESGVYVGNPVRCLSNE